MNVGGGIKTWGLVCALTCFLFRVDGEASVNIYHWFCNRNVVWLVVASVVARIMERCAKCGIVGTLIKIMEGVLVRALEQILKRELFMVKTVLGGVSNQFLFYQSRHCSDSWTRQGVSST
jgi:hypothetical protein